MHCPRYVSFVCSLLILFPYGVGFSQQPFWQLLGLDDRGINCILADDTAAILAGTDSGISVYWEKRWYDVNVGNLPVTSMARLSDNVVFIGAGNGSRSDAVYIGEKIIFGPPFYALRFQQYFLEPTAMALNNNMAVPRLYAGGRNIVSVAIAGTDTLYPFDPLKIPPYAFGMTLPYCADLLLLGDTTLYAGGYDQSILTGGPGNLLVLARDSLHIARQLDVTALTQGSFVEVGPLELVISTRDSGVFFYSPSAPIPWTVIPSPNKEPVSDLLAVPGMIFSDILIAAVAGGVYTNSGHSTVWTEVGDIPAVPNCLAVRGRAGGSLEEVLMAGTTKGVYLYTRPTAVYDRQSPHITVNKAQPVVARNGEVVFTLPAGMGRRTEVRVYSMSGKLHARVPAAQSTVRLRLGSPGLFYYELHTEEKKAVSGVIINMR